MKDIYKTIHGGWTDKKPPENEIAETINVRDDVIVGFLLSKNYPIREFNQEVYDKAMGEFNKQAAMTYLKNTDYITVQWADESALGIEHTRSEDEYREILLKRQAAREAIRNIV